jgi:predicted RNA-binding protein with PUA-like domain
MVGGSSQAHAKAWLDAGRRAKPNFEARHVVFTADDAAEPRFWIFQPVRSGYHLPSAIASKSVGDEDAWPVIRNAAEMNPGDKVMFYQLREDQGIYACGEILSKPDRQPVVAEPYAGSGRQEEQAVRVRYTQILSRPFGRAEMGSHPVLRNMQMMRLSDCINCRVTPEEWIALNELVESTQLPRLWWVNQGASYSEEGNSGYMRSPQAGAGGRAFQPWTNMTLVRPGDWVLNYARKQVRALSRVVEPATATTVPGPEGEDVPGWFVPLETFELKNPIELEEIPGELRTAPVDGGPFNYRGGVNQGYLYPLPARFADQFFGDFEGRLPGTIELPNRWGDHASTPASKPASPGAKVIERAPDSSTEAGFDAITRALAQDGLHFPEEVISNYLLALQAKRFVILTGISGTGKTRIAMAVARHFRPVVEVERPTQVPADAIEFSVLPYMLKYNRMILPVSLMNHLEIPPPDASGGTFIEVRYPGGTDRLRVSDMGSGTTRGILFKGAFREWFTSTFSEGDGFLVRVHTSSDGRADELEYIAPQKEVQREVLSNYRVVAVRPDWTDNRGLLGYYNPITESYASTEFLRLLLDAGDEELRAEVEGRPAYPYFVVLDEMNLARVEHYFSDFLSALESGEPIDLHHSAVVEAGEAADPLPVPRRLRIPGNVYFTGTVNVDETTYMFSPKVLDRAFTIEFNEVDLRGFGVNVGSTLEGGELRLSRLPPALEQLGPSGEEDWRAFGEIAGGELRELLIRLHGILEDDHRHFGYRVANEIARFIRLAAEQGDGSEVSLRTALDIAIMQKVLPKLHGTQQELEAVLQDLFSFAVSGDDATGGDQEVSSKRRWRIRSGRLEPAEADVGTPVLFPRTAAKLWRMIDRLRKQGFTAFVQ